MSLTQCYLFYKKENVENNSNPASDITQTSVMSVPVPSPDKWGGLLHSYTVHKHALHLTYNNLISMTS